MLWGSECQCRSKGRDEHSAGPAMTEIHTWTRIHGLDSPMAQVRLSEMGLDRAQAELH